jgi:ERCC4-type nuclease
MINSSISLIIDNRERIIKEYFISRENILKPKINIFYENLNLGDIIISFDNKPIFIFERKTLSDLSASIKDNRYNEQKLRLINQSKNGSKVIFIIENFSSYNTLDNHNKFINGLPTTTLLSSIINITILQNFGIFVTKDIQETCNLLNNIINRMIINPNKYDITLKNKQDNYVLERKNKNVNKNNIIIHILSQIPSISTNKAKAIAEIHPTLNSLILKLNQFKENCDKIKYLENIPINRNGKIGKLGNTTAIKIIDYLL